MATGPEPSPDSRETQGLMLTFYSPFQGFRVPSSAMDIALLDSSPSINLASSPPPSLFLSLFWVQGYSNLRILDNHFAGNGGSAALKTHCSQPGDELYNQKLGEQSSSAGYKAPSPGKPHTEGGQYTVPLGTDCLSCSTCFSLHDYILPDRFKETF